MRTGGGLLLIVVGVLALWIVVTGRLSNLQSAWGTLQHGAGAGVTPATLPGSATKAAPSIAGYALPPLPTFPVAHVS